MHTAGRCYLYMHLGSVPVPALRGGNERTRVPAVLLLREHVPERGGKVPEWRSCALLGDPPSSLARDAPCNQRRQGRVIAPEEPAHTTTRSGLWEAAPRFAAAPDCVGDRRDSRLEVRQVAVHVLVVHQGDQGVGQPVEEARSSPRRSSEVGGCSQALIARRSALVGVTRVAAGRPRSTLGVQSPPGAH